MILVTGARGFIGTNLLGGWSGTPLRVLLRPETPDDTPGVEVVRARLDDAAALDRAMDGIDTIVHLASKNVDRDGSGFVETNVDGTRSLAAAAVRNNVRRIVYISSCGVYGHSEQNDAPETTPVGPDTPFARSKAEAEAVLRAHHERGEIETVILRHRFVYGPADAHFIPGLLKLVRAGRPIPLSGDAKMSLIHVADLARIVRRVCDPGFAAPRDPIVHVNDGRPLSLRAIVTALAEASGTAPPRFVPIPFALLYYPVRLLELIRGSARGSVTSERLLLFGKNQTFSNDRLLTMFPDLEFLRFEDAVRPLVAPR